MNELHPEGERLVLLLQGRLSEQERGEVLPHVASCGACAKNLAALQEGLDLLRQFGPRSAKPPPLPALEPARLTVASWPARRRFLAAAAAAALLAAGIWFLWPRGAVVSPPETAVGTVAWAKGGGAEWQKGVEVRPGQEISNGAAGSLGVKFGNGVAVSWNRDTLVRVQSASEIFLAKGEIHVRVPREGRGFAVSTPQGRLVDLGTAFLARVDEGRTTATVLQGTVEAAAGPVSRRLGEGERAVLNGGIAVDAVKPEELDNGLAWVREAIFPGDFESVPVADLLDLIESVSAFRFDVDRDKAKAVKVTASFGGASSEAIVEALLKALGWKWERKAWIVQLQVP